MIKDKIIEEESRSICRSSLKMLLNIMGMAGICLYDNYRDVLSERELMEFESIMGWIQCKSEILKAEEEEEKKSEVSEA